MVSPKKKRGIIGSKDSFVTQFSRLRPFLKSIYNFWFNETNFGLTDAKMAILKAAKVSNWSE